MHGRHIKIVGEGAASLLGSPAIIESFLSSLVEKLGMRSLGKPIVHDVEIDIAKLGAEPFEDEGGVTGIVVLSTSHCAIHTWPARNPPEFVLDVFSCRQFKAVEVEAHCRDMIGAQALATTDVSESLKGPREDVLIAQGRTVSMGKPAQ
jgi:S-adenosylmethionine/arginine decarboxylase-like enzyme